MIAFIIFYCIFSILVFAGFIAAGLDHDESMDIRDYLASLVGPFLFPLVLGHVLYKIMFGDKVI